MKKILKLTMLLLTCMLIIGITDVEAQYGKKKKKKKKDDDKEYFDESGGFKHKLWYGGGFTLGFNGNNNVSVFGIGISPMVGYKITDAISIGPRVTLDYILYKERFVGGVDRIDLLTYGGGVFGRAKVFQSLFAHVEYSVLNQAFPAYDNFARELVAFREITNNFFIGGGYSSSAGGGLGYEISLLYNVLEPEDSIDLPIDFRVGFTWNF